jgi:hypothetical protein
MATYSGERQVTKITAATTTDVLAARGNAADEARIKSGMMTIRNIGTADNTITVIRDVSATDYEISEFMLSAGEEWQNPWDKYLTGTTDKLQIITSSTSELHVEVNFIQKVA